MDLPDWTQSNAPLPSPTAAFPPNKKPAPPRPPIPKTKWKSESTPSSKSMASLPIDLNLADDEQSHRKGLGRGSNSSNSPEVIGSLSLGKKMNSPVENIELLYEYFPLSLDDWLVFSLQCPYAFLSLGKASFATTGKISWK